MSFAIEVYYDDGNLQYIADTAFADCYPDNGDSVQDDYLFQFGDLSEGLIMRLRHHTPKPVEAQPESYGLPRFASDMEEADDFDDPRGVECLSRKDGYVVIADPDELSHVQEVRYNNRTVLIRMEGELVNLMTIDRLSRIYFNEEATDGVFMAIASLYHYLVERQARTLGSTDEGVISDDVDGAIAREIGITRATLEAALAYEQMLVEGGEEESQEDGAYEDDETGFGD